MEKPYELVIGLEVHIQLNTVSKQFCGDANLFNALPNTQVSAYSLGHPGTLPQLNREAVVKALKLGLATSCHINKLSTFDRKHYFYPDLPKGYQITQFHCPLCTNGKLVIVEDGDETEIPIKQIHLEEDSGRTINEDGGLHLDYNRAGVPLVELVTEPCLQSADQAEKFLRTLRQLVRSLGISTGNMEEGTLRCDANVSVKVVGQKHLNAKTELKNLNSISQVGKGILFEEKRQAALLEEGSQFQEETRTFDPKTGETIRIRLKDSSVDYRFLPEPDLPPLRIEDSTLENIRRGMPDLPWHIELRALKEYSLSTEQSRFLAESSQLWYFFQSLIVEGVAAGIAMKWIQGPIRALTKKIEDLQIDSLLPSIMAELIFMVESGEVNRLQAERDFLPRIWGTEVDEKLGS